MTDSSPPPGPRPPPPPARPPAGPVATLPVFATVAGAFRSALLENIRYLPRAALSPVVISLLLFLLQVRFGLTEVPSEEEPAAVNMTGNLLFSLAGLVPYVMFAVAWHRLILFGPQRGLPSYLPSWGTRHWLFLAYMFAIGIVLFLPFLGADVVGRAVLGSASQGPAESGQSAALLVLLWIAVAVFAGWLASRLSFVLPARAIDESYGLGDSWRQTRGQGFRILAAVILVNLAILLPSLVVGGLLGAGGGVVGGINAMGQAHLLEAAILFIGVLPLLLLGFLAAYLATALGVTVLSIAFRTCSGWTAHAGGV